MKNRFCITLLSFLLMGAATYAANCGKEAKGETADMVQSWNNIDSLLVAQVGEDVADIIIHADSIVGQVIPWNGRVPTPQRLPEWMEMLTKYTLCLPIMYQSDRKVYSRFETYATLTFMLNEKTATMQLDFGIGKWVLTDSTGKMVVHHDMPDLQLLPMLRMLFPDNELLKKKYDEHLQTD